MNRTATLVLSLLAVGLAAVPAAAQHGSHHWAGGYSGGRYWPPGHYTYSNGNYYLSGAVCHGYACEADYRNAYAATVVVKKEYVGYGWSLNPYQQAPAAPAADSATNKFLESMLLKDQQNAAFQQQMILLLMQSQLGGRAAPIDPNAPAPQFQPIPPAAPHKAAPAKLPPLEAFVQTHCVACHGSNGAKGNLDLSDLSKLTPERWADCWDAVCDDTMPPKNKVPAAEKTAVKAEFRQRIFARK